MDAVLSAVLGDLTSRFISFIVDKYQAQAQTTNADNEISRLQRLLVRASAVVTEAEGRQLTNPAMLLQLKQLRKSMYRGFFVMDTAIGIPGTRPKRRATARNSYRLKDDMDNLEATLDGMKEFLLILMHCPRVVRQPYSAYMFMERCMFGRHAEKERVVNFLLHPCSSLDVLPIVGRRYVGKGTLVEHACREEAVQRNFPHILRLSSDDLSDLARNRRKLDVSGGKCLIIAELVDDKDVVAWDEIQHSLGHGVKVILISRMDRVSSLGTVEALRLVALHQEEYWYFFRVLAFGSADPYDHHPDLISVAKEIVAEGVGCFMMANTITILLRTNMSIQFWRRVLWSIRKVVHTHKLVHGKDQRNSMKGLSYVHSLIPDGPVLFCINKYKTTSLVEGDLSNVIKLEDALTARVVKYGEEFHTVIQSQIPPFCRYITQCVFKKPEGVDLGNEVRLKRKRNC